MMPPVARFDIVVIGLGLAGAVAALESLRLGASVLVVETATPPTAGGNSLVSGQGFIGTDDAREFSAYLRSLRVDYPNAAALAERFERVPVQLAEVGVPVSRERTGADFQELPGAGAVVRWRAATARGATAVEVVSKRAVRAGADVRYGITVAGLRRLTGRRIEVTLVEHGRMRRVNAEFGTIVATGGSAARWSREAPSTAGTPHATGGGVRLAEHLGAQRLRRVGRSGPFYGFSRPGSRSAVVPWPLYSSRGAPPVLLSRPGLRRMAVPETGLHGLRRTQSGRLVRQVLGPALIALAEEDLARGAVVREWPDGHAEGWARRFLPPWTQANDAEVKAGWITPIRDELRLRKAGVRRGSYGMPLTPFDLNSMGGLLCDPLQRVLGPDGMVPGLYAAGEIASWFRDRYQGSGNLSECVIQGSVAAASALRGG